jgi:serine/threonine protein kinase/tetratricopeptide (TPR) repeat protein
LTERTGDAEHWEELQTLFDQFERTAPEERETALAIACSDPRLRHRVLELLGANDAVQRDPDTDRGSSAKSLPSSFIGPYRLLREIGSGGIGAVYLAERVVDGVVLRSAVKVLAPHAVDSSFIERFYREQQNLAALDHPNITRLLDAGWDAGGRPYLVMEYVEGEHLDEYCDARNLSVAERLRVFLQICDAMSDAHRNLIVHLDLKPSNVLVSKTGTVKLLDFGTSKLIRLDGNPTSTVMATPAYASPEQLLNEPVSTASDVFGLGAILFELLVGRAPFGKTSAAIRIEAAMREVEPDSITKVVTAEAAQNRGVGMVKLQQLLHGDLAAIVASCLRSRPKDRYSSVGALAEEINRHLNLHPVLAHRQTLSYTAGKFIRRNRTASAVTCGVLLTVTLSVAYAWSQQQQALREAERSVRMRTFLFSLFKMANPNYTGKPVATVPEFLQAGMAKLPDYIHEAADLREAQLGLAESMFESGDYGNARAAFDQIIGAATAQDAVADKAEAEAYAGAIEVQQGNLDAGIALESDAYLLAQSREVAPRVRVVSEVLFARDADNRGPRTDENLRVLRAAVQESRERRLAKPVTALALNALGNDLDLRGDVVEAKAIFQDLLAVYGQDPSTLCDRSETYAWIAWIDDQNGDAAGSVPLYQKAYDGYVACAGAESRGALEQLPYWAGALIQTGRAQEALPMLEQALPIWRRVQGNDPSASGMLFYLGLGYIKTGRFAEAERFGNELITLLTGRQAPEDRSFGMAHLVVGEALLGEHRYRDALPHARIAQDLLSQGVRSAYGRTMMAEAINLVKSVDSALRESTGPK